MDVCDPENAAETPGNVGSAGVLVDLAADMVLMGYDPRTIFVNVELLNLLSNQRQTLATRPLAVDGLFSPHFCLV